MALLGPTGPTGLPIGAELWRAWLDIWIFECEREMPGALRRKGLVLAEAVELPVGCSVTVAVALSLDVALALGDSVPMLAKCVSRPVSSLGAGALTGSSIYSVACNQIRY